MESLTKDDARRLADAFTRFAAGVAAYRGSRGKRLGAATRQRLADLEGELMAEANAVGALAGVFALEAVGQSAGEIGAAVAEAGELLKRVAATKTALSVITGVLSLAAALGARDPLEVLRRFQALQKLAG